jgi:transposase
MTLLDSDVSHSSIDVLDKLAFVHEKSVKQHVAGIGVELLFVPAYSPRLNPVESILCVVKSQFTCSRMDRRVARIRETAVLPQVAL